MAALYLLSQLEYFFRMRSRYLDAEGTVIRPVPAQLRVLVPTANVGARISRIRDAFLMYVYRTPSPLARRLRLLERNLLVAQRLDQIRNPAMHGPLGDTSSEGRFYGLLLSMSYYSERTAVNIAL